MTKTSIDRTVTKREYGEDITIYTRIESIIVSRSDHLSINPMAGRTMFSLIVGILLAVVHAQFQSPPEQRTSFRNPTRFVDNILPNRFSFRSNNLIPFPQCLSTDSVSSLLNPSNLEQLFSRKLDDEERKLQQARNRNNDLNNGSTRSVSRLVRTQPFLLQTTSWISSKCNYARISTTVH